MPQDTFDYMDELQKRIDAAMQGATIPTQYVPPDPNDFAKMMRMRYSMAPTDQDIEKLMGLFGATTGPARGWEKTAETLAGKRAPTSWGVPGKHWKAPFEGMSSKDWVSGKSAANDAIDQIMSMFTSAGERISPYQGAGGMKPPSTLDMPAMEFGRAAQGKLGSPVSNKPSMVEPMGRTAPPDITDNAMRSAGMTPQEVERLAGPSFNAGSRVEAEGKLPDIPWPSVPTSIWNQPMGNIIADLVNNYTPRPIAQAVKSYQDMPDAYKALGALASAMGIGAYGYQQNKPDDNRWQGGAEAAQVKPQLREYVNPEQQRGIDEGIIPRNPAPTSGADVSWNSLWKEFLYDNFIRHL